MKASGLNVSMGSLAVVCVLVAGGLSMGGPLNPPAGPVASSYKTLTEVEPRTAVNATNTAGDASNVFKITAPGSYYLTGNVSGVSGKRGILIASNDVVLDLNGFEVVGVGGSLDGVGATASFTNIAVRNGSVRGWGGIGVNLSSGGCVNCTIADVRAAGNTGVGIAAPSGSTVVNCGAYNNTGGGFTASIGSVVSGCVASANGGIGFSLSADSSIVNSDAYNATIGIKTGVNCTVTQCTSNSNTGDGIQAGDGSVLLGCAAGSNQGSGIVVAFGCHISKCDVRQNSQSGIVGTDQNVIEDNASFNNFGSGGAAGIRVTGAGNRIEGNNCTACITGVNVSGTKNLIIRNSCSNTTNWVIAANNDYGAIVDRTAVVSGAVSGNSAASSLTTTDPTANFSY